MFVEVSIDLSTTADSLLLPRDAVLDIQDKVGHVFIVTDGKARQQTVKVGLAWGENISILEGVIDSTPVICQRSSAVGRWHRNLGCEII